MPLHGLGLKPMSKLHVFRGRSKIRGNFLRLLGHKITKIAEMALHYFAAADISSSGSGDSASRQEILDGG
jgi:hypothetical protein